MTRSNALVETALTRGNAATIPWPSISVHGHDHESGPRASRDGLPSQIAVLDELLF
jgi:hypothetical protein